jgi:hypothetical protein
LSVRIRSDAFEFDRQRYSLRLEPRGFGETKSRRNLFKSQKQYSLNKKRFVFNTVIRKRYGDIIDFIEQQSMLAITKEMQALYEDRVFVMGKLTGTAGFDLNELIEAENEYTVVTMDVIDLEKKLKYSARQIQTLLPASNFTEFDTSGIVSIDAVCLFAKGVRDSVDSSNLYLSNERLRYLVSKGEYLNESASCRKLLDFVEISYDTRELFEEREERIDGKPYNFNRAWILEAGLRIPGLTTDRYDIARRKSRFIEDEMDYLEMEKELIFSMKKDAEDIRVLVEKYNFLKAREDDVKAESSLRKYLEMDGVAPVRLLAIKESILENNMKKLRIRFDILRNYIRILDASGVLSAEPVRNFLSSGRSLVAQPVQEKTP